MKTRTIQQYIAFDDTVFTNEVECRRYEKEQGHKALANRSPAEIEAALNGDDPELAAMFEAFGVRLRKARQERGELMRRPKGEAAALAAAAAQEPVDSEDNADGEDAEEGDTADEDDPRRKEWDGDDSSEGADASEE